MIIIVFGIHSCIVSITAIKQGKYKFVDGKPTAAFQTDALNLSNKCDLPFDEFIDLSQLETIEDKLNCNIYVLNIRDLPLHKTYSHLYNSLMYLSDDRQTNKYWLLCDDINKHFHGLRNIRIFIEYN
jgi:hypothetical protein